MTELDYPQIWLRWKDPGAPIPGEEFLKDGVMYSGYIEGPLSISGKWIKKLGTPHETLVIMRPFSYAKYYLHKEISHLDANGVG